jgi:hypothetical protein
LTLLAAPSPAAACEGVGCDGDTALKGNAGGIVKIWMTVDNPTPWVYDDDSESPVNVTGGMVVDAYAYAYAQGWATSWEDWKWNWLPQYVETYAGAGAEAYTSADFWYYVQANHPNGSVLYYDTDYYFTQDWDANSDFDVDSDWWWLCFGDDIQAYANAEAYAESPLYLYIPINFSFVPNQVGVYPVYAYGDSWLQYMADASYCTEFGCFGYDETGKLVIIWDEAYLRIRAIDYPNVPTGRFDVVDAPETVIQAYRLDEGVSLQPWLGGNHIYALEVEDSDGDGQYSDILHTHGGTTIILWEWTPGGHSAYASYDYFGSMSQSGWQMTVWKDGDHCWMGEGGYLYCPKIPTDALINAFLKYDPTALSRNMRGDFQEAMHKSYAMWLELQPGESLSTADYEAVVLYALSH